MNKKIIVGSRESLLAVTQSNIITAEIEKHGFACELITMKTKGDKILDRTLDKIGGKGLFVKELDTALIEKRADITVHSLKDIPTQIDENLPIIAYFKRDCPLDVLVLPKGKKELDKSKPIGCASKRRTIQLRKLYPNMDITPVRGNVQTRLKKLDDGEYSALVLAKAGLLRLGLEERISRTFTADEMIPSCGQGIIAVQGRKDETYDFIKYINDEDSEICAKAERAFAERLDGGCSSPVAVYAQIKDDMIFIRGLYADENMTFIKTGAVEGRKTEGEKLAVELAEKLL